MADTGEASADGKHYFINLILEVLTSPIDLALCAVSIFLLYKVIRSRQREDVAPQLQPELPKMKKQDFTVEELRKYDGRGEDGRILIAVNGFVFDVTKGKRFYGPDGIYSAFAGRDASRGLATFTVESSKDEYDDLSDLQSMEMDSVKEWEMQYREKYEFVGRLLKPGEEHTIYDDSDEEESTDETKKTKVKSDNVQQEAGRL